MPDAPGLRFEVDPPGERSADWWHGRVDGMRHVVRLVEDVLVGRDQGGLALASRHPDLERLLLVANGLRAELEARRRDSELNPDLLEEVREARVRLAGLARTASEEMADA